MPRLTLLLALILCTCGLAQAQRVLLFEKLTNSQSAKMYEGDVIRFRMEGDNFWQEGPIREMRPDIQALVINDRFIMLDEIAVVHLGSAFGKYAGYSLMTFGVTWTGIGLLGYNTDGDPESQISSGELAVGAGSFLSGFLINKLFGQKKFRLGKFRRLRIVDTSF